MNIFKTLILAAGVTSMALNTIDAQNSIEPLVKSNPNVVVLFYKPGCPFYRYIAPLFDTLIREMQSSGILFKTINITNQDHYKNTYHFSTVPTVIYFKNGSPALSHGSNNKTITVNAMKDTIKTIFNK